MLPSACFTGSRAARIPTRSPRRPPLTNEYPTPPSPAPPFGVPPAYAIPSTLEPPGFGVLVFSHRWPQGATDPGYFFASESEALSASGDPTALSAHKFSRLGVLGDYSRADGSFEFKLVWPGLSNTSINHWVRSRAQVVASSSMSGRGSMTRLASLP